MGARILIDQNQPNTPDARDFRRSHGRKSPHWAASNRARELRRYEFLFGQIPAFVALRLPAIDQAAKNAALATWDGQNKKRSDVGFYIGAILNYAETGQLRGIKAKAVEHHPEMPYRDVPAFYARLKALGTVDAMALQFLILTGAPRTSELIGAKHKAPANMGRDNQGRGKTDLDHRRVENEERANLSCPIVERSRGAARQTSG